MSWLTRMALDVFIRSFEKLATFGAEYRIPHRGDLIHKVGVKVYAH